MPLLCGGFFWFLVFWFFGFLVWFFGFLVLFGFLPYQRENKKQKKRAKKSKKRKSKKEQKRAKKSKKKKKHTHTPNIKTQSSNTLERKTVWRIGWRLRYVPPFPIMFFEGKGKVRNTFFFAFETRVFLFRDALVWPFTKGIKDTKERKKKNFLGKKNDFPFLPTHTTKHHHPPPTTTHTHAHTHTRTHAPHTHTHTRPHPTNL